MHLVFNIWRALVIWYSMLGWYEGGVGVCMRYVNIPLPPELRVEVFSFGQCQIVAFLLPPHSRGYFFLDPFLIYNLDFNSLASVYLCIGCVFSVSSSFIWVQFTEITADDLLFSCLGCTGWPAPVISVADDNLLQLSWLLMMTYSSYLCCWWWLTPVISTADDDLLQLSWQALVPDVHLILLPLMKLRVIAR